MNVDLRKILDGIDQWPDSAQQALADAAANIQRAITPPQVIQDMTLRDVVRAVPMDDLDLERTH